MLEVIQIPVWNDNYAHILVDTASGAAAVVDAPEAAPILRVLEERKLRLEAILNTHHHGDHVGANADLIAHYGPTLRVVAHESSRDIIPGVNEPVGDGDCVRLGESVANVLHTPGHTLDHIAFWFQESGDLFAGDTLFVSGCGRMFEGDAKTMQASLARLRGLPAATRLWCAHEYTLANLRFAAAVEPANSAVGAKRAWAEAQVGKGGSTVPSTLGEERSYNPFLRWDAPEVMARAGEHGAGSVENPTEVFGAIRRWKDQFR